MKEKSKSLPCLRLSLGLGNDRRSTPGSRDVSLAIFITSGAGKGKRGGSKETLGEERWRRVGMSGSLRGWRSEEMTQSNASSTLGAKAPLESQRG